MRQLKKLERILRDALSAQHAFAGKEMVRTLVIGALAGTLVGLLLAGAALAQTRPAATGVETTGQSPPRTRPRTRITVSPRAPYRTFSTPYPTPYPYEYPGPGFARQCASRLVAEYRASGPVLVPRMHCWWEPGRSDLVSWPDGLGP
jgi:hypothetical protein